MDERLEVANTKTPRHIIEHIFFIILVSVLTVCRASTKQLNCGHYLPAFYDKQASGRRIHFGWRNI